jgi:hypothetical protein
VKFYFRVKYMKKKKQGASLGSASRRNLERSAPGTYYQAIFASTKCVKRSRTLWNFMLDFVGKIFIFWKSMLKNGERKRSRHLNRHRPWKYFSMIFWGSPFFNMLFQNMKSNMKFQSVRKLLTHPVLFI